MAHQVVLSPKKKARIDYAETVKVLVGSEKKAFIVHEQVLTAHSSFFRAACSAQWKQENGIIELPFDSVENFNNYLAWIYDQDGSENEASDTATELINTYILADKLGDWKSANQIANWMLLSIGDDDWTISTPENVELCYAHTMDGAPLRRMLVDVWVAGVRNSDPTEFLQQSDLPADFLRDVAIMFAKLSRHSGAEKADYEIFCRDMYSQRCQYHLHNAENTPTSADCNSTPDMEPKENPEVKI